MSSLKCETFDVSLSKDTLIFCKSQSDFFPYHAFSSKFEATVMKVFFGVGRGGGVPVRCVSIKWLERINSSSFVRRWQKAASPNVAVITCGRDCRRATKPVVTVETYNLAGWEHEERSATGQAVIVLSARPAPAGFSGQVQCSQLVPQISFR